MPSPARGKQLSAGEPLGQPQANCPILLDTGSSSLVIPFWKIGWQNLGLPTGFDVVHYGNGVSIVYADVPTTVDFGGGAATTPTSVHVGILPYPRNLDSLVLIASGGAFGPNGNGILGIGPNVGSYAVSGPGNVVTTDLPGQLNEGTLIDIPGGYMQFGPNTGTPITSVTGAPITVLNVQIGGYDPNGLLVTPLDFRFGRQPRNASGGDSRHGPDNRLRPAGHGYLNLNT